MSEYNDMVYFSCLLSMYLSKWVGVIVTLMLIAASVYKGFFHNEWIIFLDVVSILAGYVIIDNLEFHKHQD